MQSKEKVRKKMIEVMQCPYIHVHSHIHASGFIYYIHVSDVCLVTLLLMFNCSKGNVSNYNNNYTAKK